MFKTIALVVALLGCSSSDGDDFGSACSKNETQLCACPGGAMGAQTCAADGSAWGKCECMPEGAAGTGGGAGTGSGGAAGATGAKECEEDADCPTVEKPWCVEHKCIGSIEAVAGDDCSAPHVSCVDRTYCDGESCLVGKASGKACEADEMCASGHCAGGNCD
jgi:hypothetical protein